MSKKLIFKGLIVLSSTTVLLVTALVINVAMISDSGKTNKPIRKMASIYFLEPIDTTSQKDVKNKVLSIAGVDAAHYNSEDHKLIYSYNPELLHPDIVYYKLIEGKKYNARR